MRVQTMWHGGVPACFAQPLDVAPAGSKRPAAVKLPPMKVVQRRWTPREVDILRERFPKEGASAQLRKQLGRTAESIRRAASLRGIRILPSTRHEFALRAGKGSARYSRIRALAHMQGGQV